jgi:hypothetical protein
MLRVAVRGQHVLLHALPLVDLSDLADIPRVVRRAEPLRHDLARLEEILQPPGSSVDGFYEGRGRAAGLLHRFYISAFYCKMV